VPAFAKSVSSLAIREMCVAMLDDGSDVSLFVAGSDSNGSMFREVEPIVNDPKFARVAVLIDRWQSGWGPHANASGFRPVAVYLICTSTWRFERF
jgi:hypothetical protein